MCPPPDHSDDHTETQDSPHLSHFKVVVLNSATANPTNCTIIVSTAHLSSNFRYREQLGCVWNPLISSQNNDIVRSCCIHPISQMSISIWRILHIWVVSSQISEAVPVDIHPVETSVSGRIEPGFRTHVRWVCSSLNLYSELQTARKLERYPDIPIFRYHESFWSEIFWNH